MFHVRADMDIEVSPDSPGRLARISLWLERGQMVCSAARPRNDDIPTITLEMGEAQRFERDVIDHALEGVRSVLAEYGIYQQETVRWLGWWITVDGWGEKTWIRADDGGIVEMHFNRGDLVHDGENDLSNYHPVQGRRNDRRCTIYGSNRRCTRKSSRVH